MKVEKLTFEVKYKVGISNLDLPEDVYKELQECLDNGDTVGSDSMKYPNLEMWIVDNVRERDCYQHEVEIEDY